MLKLRTIILCAGMSPFLMGQAAAQSLGGGQSPDVSIWRIILALLICLILAGLLITLLYLKNMRNVDLKFLPKFLPAGRNLEERDIQILDQRRINTQTDICLVRCRDVEYLILLSSDTIKILSKKAAFDDFSNREDLS